VLQAAKKAEAAATARRINEAAAKLREQNGQPS
jgi:hypothetical protein